MSIRRHIDLIEAMLESTDNRRLLDKLIDFIVHDQTSDAERRVAVGRLAVVASLGQNEAAELLKLVAPTTEDRRLAIGRFLGSRKLPMTFELEAAKAAYGRYAQTK